MTPQDFIAFMERYDLTEEAVAAVLGYSRRQIGYFKTAGPIPRVVALACKGYAYTKLEENRGQFEEAARRLAAQIQVHYDLQEPPAFPKAKVKVA
jgi:hypothetical protein